MRASRRHGVVIVGAGAAGLAAAYELARRGADVLVLEARSRVGGRCWTRRFPGLDVPVELGAEFIHGEAATTHELLSAAGIPAVDSVRVQRWLDRGRVRPVNAFVEAQRALRGIAEVEPDVSFERLLCGLDLSRRTRLFARLMVQGFDAADPRRASARSIVEEWGEGGSLGASQPRPQGGYGALMDWMARRAMAHGARLQLDSAVSRIHRGRVEGRFLGSPFTVRAEKVVVTLPLGVLQAGPIRFPEKRDALRKLASGPVVRVAMRFHARFWERRFPDVAFFHVPNAPFPTFWTPLPMRAPVFTAWAGGPKAARLSGRPNSFLIAQARETVEAVFGKQQMAGAYVRDWQADPHSKGGYSYVRVGGEGAREELAAPIGDSVFFAGEATDADEAGTVAGALRSGIRAAKEVFRSWKL